MEEQEKKEIQELIEGLQRIDYVKPNEIPNIDLYMDQVTTFMDKHLESSKRYSEDKLLTKTMINNYTKNKLLPSPEKKKYSKDHMFLLIFIYYMKNILSISDIQSILGPLTEKFFNADNDVKLEDIYKEVFRVGEMHAKTLSRDVVKMLEKSKTAFNSGKGKKDEEFLQQYVFVCMLCFDVYMKKQLIEKIIDDSFSVPDPKEKK